MEEELKLQKRKRNIIGLIIIPILLSLFGALLQFLFYMPQSSNVIGNAIFNAIQGLINSIHENVLSLHWLWAISPRPTLEEFGTTGNIITIMLIVTFIVGALLSGLTLTRIDHLKKNLQRAKDELMRDDYKNKK